MCSNAKLILGLVGVLGCAPVLAKEYWTLKPALIEAIDAPSGAVRGDLVGPAADLIVNTTKSTAPVTFEVTTIKAFKQEGCKQFRIIIRQDNVPTTDGRLATITPTYTMNMCRDGSAPVEGMDLEAVGKMLNQNGELADPAD